MYRTFVTSSRGTASDISLYRQQADKWWDVNGIWSPLHAMNSVRVPLIRDGLLNSSCKEPESLSRPLTGFKILDVGCGGGILSEPLARLGANVTGLDPVSESIEVARAHAEGDDNLTYICGTIDEISSDVGFDAVVASEVIEHVDDPGPFVERCVSLTKENGSLFFTTFNRTWLSYALGIVMAEYVLGIIPKGTHTWDMFMPPEDLKFLLESKGCEVRLVNGFHYNPLTCNFSWNRNTSLQYAIHAIRRAK